MRDLCDIDLRVCSDNKNTWIFAALRDADRTEDLAPGSQIIFAATGVTDGALLKGVRFFGEGTRTSSIVLTLMTGKVRFIESIHLAKKGDVKVRFA